MCFPFSVFRHLYWFRALAFTSHHCIESNQIKYCQLWSISWGMSRCTSFGHLSRMSGLSNYRGLLGQGDREQMAPAEFGHRLATGHGSISFPVHVHARVLVVEGNFTKSAASVRYGSGEQYMIGKKPLGFTLQNQITSIKSTILFRTWPRNFEFKFCARWRRSRDKKRRAPAPTDVAKNKNKNKINYGLKHATEHKMKTGSSRANLMRNQAIN
jgi:hypothetical protein